MSWWFGYLSEDVSLKESAGWYSLQWTKWPQRWFLYSETAVSWLSFQSAVQFFLTMCLIDQSDGFHSRLLTSWNSAGNPSTFGNSPWMGSVDSFFYIIVHSWKVFQSKASTKIWRKHHWSHWGWNGGRVAWKSDVELVRPFILTCRWLQLCSGAMNNVQPLTPEAFCS